MPLTLGQAAKIAGVSKPTMSKWLKDGKLSGSKNTDGVYAIDRSDLDRYMAFHRSKTTPLSSVNQSVSRTETEMATPQHRNATGNAAIDALSIVDAVKYAAAIEILRAEKAALATALAKSEQQYGHLEARMDDMQATYEETIRNITRMIEDKRPQPQEASNVETPNNKKRKKFLGIF